MALAVALFRCILLYWLQRLRGPLTLPQRARWLQSACRLVLSSLQIRYTFTGTPPQSGVVVSNHLSYLDIAIYSAIMPCFFVAKQEISTWPYFGRAASTGGTLFLNRTSPSSAAQVASAIAERLALPVPTLFFPEGTSTDGSSVLPFHRWLFEPAARAAAPVTAAAVRYSFTNGVPEKELCWYGDQPFLPHLWKALAISGFTAQVSFGVPHVYTNRRIAAAETHAAIVAMRAASAPSSQS